MLRLEELDRIAVGILELDLPAARSDLHFVAEVQPRFLQRPDLRREVRDLEDYPVPTAGFLSAPIGQRTRSRCPRPAQQDLEIADRDARECRQLLRFQLEAELPGIEGDGAADVLHQVPDTVK